MLLISGIIIFCGAILYFFNFNAKEQEQVLEKHKQKVEQQKQQQIQKEEKKKLRVEEEKKLKEKEKLLAEERKQFGTHCLSAWDGSYDPLVKLVKRIMKDPDSFKHRETRTTKNINDMHFVYMTYEGKNSFGGVSAEKISAKMSADCKLIEVINTKN